jgi:hypothetical protein
MPADLRCPGCDVGDDAGGVSMFSDRGWDEHGSAVVRCGNCGCGFVLVARGLLRRRSRGQLIEPDAWARMEQIWERTHPLPSTAAPPMPDPHELAEALIMAGLSGEHVVHQLAEAADLSEAEASRLLSELGSAPPA